MNCKRTFRNFARATSFGNLGAEMQPDFPTVGGEVNQSYETIIRRLPEQVIKYLP